MEEETAQGDINPLLRADGVTGIALRLDVREVEIGDEVLVTWNLPDILPGQRDWIGMYKLSECVQRCV